MADALEGTLGRMESGPRVRESLALAYWDAVVGPQAAAASEPECVRDGVLFVRTKSSVWSHELTFLQSHIKSELNKRIGKPMIQSIVFRAKGITRSVPEDPDREPSGRELEAVALPPAEQVRLERDLAALKSIPNEMIRAAMAGRIVRERKLRHWRLSHGWRLCPSCGVAHQAPEELCPICRVCG